MTQILHHALPGAAAAAPSAETGRSAELEWLFELAGRVKALDGEQNMLLALLSAGADKIGAQLVGMEIPSKRLLFEHVVQKHESLAKAWQRARTPLASWAARRQQPLIMNKPSPKAKSQGKLLAVPVERDDHASLGVLAFFRAAGNPDFTEHEAFIALHLGRQAAQLVDSQFDAMTGLYTHAGLEQNTQPLLEGLQDHEHCILYVDIDHLHVANQLHGFEVGDELIVRIAGLLAPPLLPQNAVAGRLATDKFAVVLPDCSTEHALKLAQSLASAAAQLEIGPREAPVEVSVSCGIAPLTAMAQGFSRALQAAELACKTAKSHGRGSAEVYAFDNDSMMRRHGDVVAIGQLRSALKHERLALYAQPIVPLRGPPKPSGYEILLRLQDEQGDMVSLGPLINAAHRYQLLPSIDKWVSQRALEMLAPFRTMLSNRDLSMSINISGQSISDETFGAQLGQWIKAARLPSGCLTIEITEQAAVTSLQRAQQLITRLKALGCQFALDDFGTGANSLTTLNGLQISRVKIDGSFVRNVATDRSSRSTVRAIVELAAGLSIDTVAEFVETEEIAQEVRDLGVDYAQGYAYGRPRPLKDILAELSAEESQRVHRLFLEN